ncbi:MAG: phage portal protein [Deltaproteobacteria bacterium]|nr:phage portal protein [Deltaproteobacteria bacterium]
MAEGKVTILSPDKVMLLQNQMGVWTQPPDDWFGPGQPLPPAAPPAVKGRQFDFPAGSNLAYIPRGDQALSFADLRALALNCDLVRLVIETRKDQLCKLRWAVKAQKGNEKNAAAAAQAKAATALFKRPDKVHMFNQWLRMLLEDMFVTDAATIYPRLTRGGGLYALDLLDGATIRPVIDQSGRPPLPPDPAYQQVLKGIPAADFTRAELLYLPRNPLTWRVYGLSPVEQIVILVNIILRRQLHLLQYFTEGNLPDALLEVPEGWSTEQIREWQQYWDSLFAGNTAQRRRGTWVPKGMVPHQVKEIDLKTPVEEWFARVVCY